jgi:general stress protein 26
MDSREVMKKVGAIIEAHGTGLLATVDEEGDPHVRWLTPTLLPDSPGALYAITAPKFAKVLQVRAHRRDPASLPSRDLTGTMKSMASR